MSESTYITLNLPAAVVVGRGAVEQAGEHVARLGGTRVLVVADPFFVANGTVEQIAERLRADFRVAIFDGVDPDPTDRNVLDGVGALRACQADLIVAIGGGSALDVAKMIAVLATNPEPISRYQGYHKIERPGLPVIAIPTTAGTGSEATQVTVISDSANETKMMIFDRNLVPKVAMIDPSLSATMPSSLTAYVGLDALTHGIEAYVSRVATPFSDVYARACIALVGRHLERAWAEPDDQAAREGMAIAAFHGGCAFSNASVGLIHGMSRPIGAVFHVPHGLSNAVLLPTVAKFSLRGAPERYADVARLLGAATPDDDVQTAGERLVSALAELNHRLAVPRLGELEQIDRNRFDAMVEKMARDALASGSPARNPVVPTAGEIIGLYDDAW